MLIGVDFSGRALEAGLVDQSSLVRSASAELAAGADAREVLDAIAELVRRLAPRPDAVGVAIPGQVNHRGHCWRFPNAPALEGVAIAQEIAARLDCPVAVENRATAAALAERLFGYGRAHPSFILVTLGTGVGGGLVVGHQLYSGAHGFGGEIGHVLVDPATKAPACACGRRGCLEVFAGAAGVVRRFSELGGRRSRLEDVMASAREGEAAGIGALESVGVALGRALSKVQNLMDLNAVVFAGPLAAAFAWFESSLRIELRARSFSPLLAEVPLLVSSLGDATSVIGAAYLSVL